MISCLHMVNRRMGLSRKSVGIDFLAKPAKNRPQKLSVCKYGNAPAGKPHTFSGKPNRALNT